MITTVALQVVQVKGKKIMHIVSSSKCNVMDSCMAVSVNKHQNYVAFNNNPYITASHQAALIVHVSVKMFCLV